MEKMKAPMEQKKADFEARMNIQIASLSKERDGGRVPAKLKEAPTAEERAAVLVAAEADNFAGSVVAEDGKIAYRTKEQVEAAKKAATVPEMQM